MRYPLAERARGSPAIRSVPLLVLAIAIVMVTASPGPSTPPGDNGQIAFRRYLNDATRGPIFAIDPDGTDLRQITHPRRGVIHNSPDWSPDGTSLVFSRLWAGGEHLEFIFKVLANGHGLRAVSKRDCQRSDRCAGDSLPAWSPNGERIAFTRYSGGQWRKDSFDLFVIGADGRGARQVTDGGPRYADFCPQWSPDGSRLVFARFDEPGWDGPSRELGAVFTVRLDGSGLRRLTPWRLDAGDCPDWSPDGRWILFHSHIVDEAESRVFLVHPNGKGLHAIGGKGGWLSGSFSPDGTMITIARTPGTGPDGNADVFVMDLDGSGYVNVTDSGRWESFTDWGATPTL